MLRHVNRFRFLFYFLVAGVQIIYLLTYSTSAELAAIIRHSTQSRLVAGSSVISMIARPVRMQFNKMSWHKVLTVVPDEGGL